MSDYSSFWQIYIGGIKIDRTRAKITSLTVHYVSHGKCVILWSSTEHNPFLPVSTKVGLVSQAIGFT